MKQQKPITKEEFNIQSEALLKSNDAEWRRINELDGSFILKAILNNEADDSINIQLGIGVNNMNVLECAYFIVTQLAKDTGFNATDLIVGMVQYHSSVMKDETE